MPERVGGSTREQEQYVLLSFLYHELTGCCAVLSTILHLGGNIHPHNSPIKHWGCLHLIDQETHSDPDFREVGSRAHVLSQLYSLEEDLPIFPGDWRGKRLEQEGQ